MAYGMMQASQLLHGDILGRLFHNPLSYFDTTPLGRIVNRFSKDVDMIDNTLPFNIRSWINCLFSVGGGSCGGRSGAGVCVRWSAGSGRIVVSAGLFPEDGGVLVC